MSDKKNLPLVVDLDGTLVNTDLFLEAAFVFIGKNFFNFFRMVYWLLKYGRGGLKLNLEKNVPLRADVLPFHQDVIDWLKIEKSKNRRLIMATGSPQNYAQAVADHLGFFSEVFGVSKERPRLTGKNKARFLVKKFGVKGFDYIGNSHIDYHLWREARHSITAHALPFVVKKAKRYFDLVYTIPNDIDLRFWFFKKAKNFFQQEWRLVLSVFCLPVFCFRVLCSLGGFVFFNLPLFLFFSFSLILENFFSFALAQTAFYLAAVLMGELNNLHANRKAGYLSLFNSLHPYFGLLFVPLFLFSFIYCTFVWPKLAVFGFIGYFIFEALYFSKKSVFLSAMAGIILFILPVLVERS